MGETIDKVKGKAKEVGGVITGDEHLKQQGRMDQMKGAVKGAASKFADAAHHVVDAAKRKVDKI